MLLFLSARSLGDSGYLGQGCLGLGFKGLVFSVQSAETGSPDCRLEAKDCTDDRPRGEGPSEQSVGIPAGFELNIESVPFATCHWALSTIL